MEGDYGILNVLNDYGGTRERKSDYLRMVVLCDNYLLNKEGRIFQNLITKIEMFADFIDEILRG